jgi:hypothetical protein
MSNQRKHISSTHNERYYHIPLSNSHVARATVFFRQNGPRNLSPGGEWEASIALCDERDQFCKQIGRNVARRKFFSKNYQRKAVGFATPDYETALRLVIDAAAKRDYYVEAQEEAA